MVSDLKTFAHKECRIAAQKKKKFFGEFCPTSRIFLVSVLLSALVERFFVSRMRFLFVNLLYYSWQYSQKPLSRIRRSGVAGGCSTALQTTAKLYTARLKQKPNIITFSTLQADIKCADARTASWGQSEFVKPRLIKYMTQSILASFEEFEAGLRTPYSRLVPQKSIFASDILTEPWI